MTDTVVVEGQVRLREGKKWKNRWVILRKPSPVADCLSLLVYKDRAERSRGQRERSQATLGAICGLEALHGFEGVSYALTILSLTQSVTLGFDAKENLLAWDARIRYSLGEVHRFGVTVQPGTKLESGPASLHLCNNLLVIARDIPPVIVGQWRLSDLRRYGAVPNGFVFEGGTRCGYWTGVFFLACTEGEQITFLFDCLARGISPSRAPFGLRPTLPDPSTDPSSVEDRITQEASQLEKRLSLLSISSRQSSTASHSSYSASLGGDDRSISSSSSDTSHSDTSLSSRLATWADPVRYSTPSDSSVPSAGATALKPSVAPTSASSEERLYGTVPAGLRPPSKPPHPRGLQEAGRQSSTDSGIATGSHSSYSGSFSSYTGSLDTSQVEVDEFGSLLSLAANPTPNQTPSASHRLLPQLQNVYPSSITPTPPFSLVPEVRPCMCPVTGGSHELDSEYQVPGQALQHYDYPRSLLARETGGSARMPSTDSGPLESSSSAPKLTSSRSLSGSGDGTAPPAGFTVPQHTLCPVCGGMKVMASPHTGFLPLSALPDKPKYEVSSSVTSPATERISIQAEERGRYEPMGSYAQQKSLWESGGHASATPSSSVRLFRSFPLPDPKSSYVCMAFSMEPTRSGEFSARDEGRPLVLAGESVPPITDCLQSDKPNYINIPVSPMSKRQLHYMELDLQDIPESSPTVRGASSTKYAHIDITATEAAQRVGAQHAQGREERLQELEQRRRGTLN